MHTKGTFQFVLTATWRACLGGAIAFFISGGFAAENPPTNPTLLLSIEGTVQVWAATVGPWNAARTNQTLQTGDRVRTGDRSRATIRLSDRSVLRVNELTTLEIRPPATPDGKSVLDLKSGSSYFFNRERPAEMQFRTPLVSGAIRGTEFHLAVNEADGRTVVTLLDGEVQLTNALGEVTLHNGEEGVISPGVAPSKSAVIQANRVIQWVLYYPAVLDAEELSLDASERTALAASLDAYRRGDVLRAIALYPEGRPAPSESERIYHAALLLAAGQVPAAERDLQNVPASSRLSEALRKLIAVVTRPTNELSLLAHPATATEWMVESYVEQGRLQLDNALEAARRATELAPQFGLGWTRRAELEFSFGHVREAREALERGRSLAPQNPEGHTLRGFILAAENHFATALEAFGEAIALDGALSHAWLGQGLCKIRLGRAEDGRMDLQVAATLEPLRAVWRSYLGKAWSQTGDDARAAKELNLAKRLDPNDPTAWLYSALLAQRQNRVNEAVEDLEHSKDLNDNRAVYRSRLLLDQDRAVRSANLASIYRDAGMTEVSVREASRAVNDDFGNYSAHLFLANSYDALRDPRRVTLRYETPWFSEQLLANLLGPVDAGALAQNISQQEYSRFFEGDRVGMSSSTEYFSHGDYLERASQYGTLGRVGYALDANYRSENGWRPNNDLESLELSAKVKVQITAEDSILLQVLSDDLRAGDVAQYYNQKGDPIYGVGPSSVQRVRERQDPNLFLGYHHEWSPGVHTLFLGSRLQDRLELTGTKSAPSLLVSNGMVRGEFPPAVVSGPFQLENRLEAYSAELEQIVQTPWHTWVVGGRYQHGDIPTHSDFGSAVQDIAPHFDRVSLYAYDYWRVFETLQLIGGVSYDRLEFPANAGIPPVTNAVARQERVSPKAGIYFTPRAGTTLRAAYTRSLGGAFYDNSVRLEPVQVAGFNQSFRSLIPESIAGQVPGSRFETFGVALDQTVARRTYLTVAGELLRSKADRAVGVFGLDANPPPGVPVEQFAFTTRERLDFTEKTLAVTVNQLVGPNTSLGVTYRLSVADLRNQFIDYPVTAPSADDRDVKAILHQVNLFANVHFASGFFGRAEAIWSQQSNQRYTPSIPGDDFWQFNIYAGWRFAQRKAELRAGLLNLTGGDYRLNPLNLYSELPRGRVFTASFRFYF